MEAIEGGFKWVPPCATASQKTSGILSQNDTIGRATSDVRYLPTIVVSEFCIRQEIPPEILRACVVLPFNWDDAQKAATLDFSKAERGAESRDALKDDVEIIAQAVVKDAAFVITDDTRSFYKFAQQLAGTGQARFRPIKLEDGFDRAFFDPNGQKDFTDQLSEGDAPEA